MTKKELKKYIKDKAMEVNVSDHKQAILEQLERQKTIEPVIPQKRLSFRFKPVYAFALVMMITLSIAILRQPQSPTNPVIIEAYDEPLMTSVTSIAYAYDITNEETLMLFYQTLETSLIEEEVEDLTPYLQLMEHLLSTDASFDMTVIPSTDDDIIRHLRFTTTDLLGETITYDLLIAKEQVNEAGFMRISAEMIIMDESFELAILIDLNDTNRVKTILKTSDTTSLEVIHEITEGTSEYRVKMTENEQTISEIRFSRNLEQGYIDLHLERAAAQGSFRFRKGINQRLRVQYAIARNNQIETGEMDIEITELPDQTTGYGFNIRPQGRPGVVIEPRERPNPPLPPRNRPRNGPFNTTI